MPAEPRWPAAAIAALNHRLADETAALQAFIAALNDEQVALAAANADALPTLAEAKLRRMHQLNDRTAARNAGLEALGLPHDRIGLAQVAQADPSLASAIDQLIRLAADAAETNRINGRLIASQLQGTQAALQALGVGPQHDAGRLYARDARAEDAPPRTGVRIIDSA